MLFRSIHPARAKILSQNLERMGAANILATNHDSQSLARRFPEFFDKIIVDAPCSGEGMFRKDMQACQEWSLSNIALCHNRQQEILEHAANMLKPGGWMVYSTCTFAPEEDEKSVALFLKSHPDFTIEEGQFYHGDCGFGKGNPEWVLQEIRNPNLEKTIRIWPHQTQGEGHYLALLKKAEKGSRIEEGEGAGEGRREKNGKREKHHNTACLCPGKPEMEMFWRFCGETLKTSGSSSGTCAPWEEIPWQYRVFGDQLYYMHKGLPDITGIKVVRPGLHLGAFKKNRFEPSHGLALFLKPEYVLRTVNMACDSTEILQYLKGEPLSSCQEPWKGWTLVTVDGFSIGWAKQAGGLLKNHYPKGLRW